MAATSQRLVQFPEVWRETHRAKRISSLELEDLGAESQDADNFLKWMCEHVVLAQCSRKHFLESIG